MDIVTATGGIAVDELHREAIQTFGGKHRTAGITDRLNEGLQHGGETGHLQLRGEMVHVAATSGVSCLPLNKT